MLHKKGNTGSQRLHYLSNWSIRLMVWITVDGLAAAWLAQLIECLSVVREAEGSSPRLDQHLGS